jgi:hypothetical protein
MTDGGIRAPELAPQGVEVAPPSAGRAVKALTADAERLRAGAERVLGAPQAARDDARGRYDAAFAELVRERWRRSRSAG